VLRKDGTVVVGALVEQSDTHVTLQTLALPTGETTQIDSAQIDRVGPLESGSSGGVPRGLSPVPQPPSSQLNPPKAVNDDGPDAVQVFMKEYTGRATLYQRSPDGAAWRPICTTPCDSRVDPRGKYMVSGFMMNDSWTFALPQGQRQVSLHPNPSTPDPGIAILGWTLLAAGLGLSSVSLPYLFGSRDALELLGVGAGAPLALIGGYCILMPLLAHTGVDITPGFPASGW
jgi:hypothetical protein